MLQIIILAAGNGTRMKSHIPKVLHLVNGIPMLVLIIQTCLSLHPKQILIVVGTHEDLIKSTVSQYINNNKQIVYCRQPSALGTGDAVKTTIPFITDDVLILNGDVPLISFETLKNIINNYYSLPPTDILVAAINVNNPTGYGRILLEKDNSTQCIGIIEEKDATDEQKKITLVNTGIYMISKNVVTKYIPLISNENNAQKEYYLTDLIKLCPQSKRIYLLSESKLGEIYNVNTCEQLAFINSHF